MSLVGWILGINAQTVVIFIVCFLLLYSYCRKQSWKNLPPGPFCLPVLGSLPFLGLSDLRESLRKLGDKYGDVYTVYLGQTRVVVLNSYGVIKEAIQARGKEFGTRPHIFFIKELCKEKGVVGSDGELWKEHRRFSLDVLREFGVGKSILEDKILEETHHLVEEIQSRSSQGHPLDPHKMLMFAVCNIIGSLTSGSRSDYNDPDFLEHMNFIDTGFKIAGKTSGLLMAFPFLRFLPGDPFKIKYIIGMEKYCKQNIYGKMVEEHKADLSMVSESRDFIEAYLKALAKEQDDPNTTYSETQLQHMVSDLFSAGTETTSTTLRWALVYMLNYPEVLDRVQQEIDEVIGPHQQPSMKHKLQMPYTEATIMEIQRMGDIVPLNVPHCTAEDVEFQGYHIPKDTMIVPNLYSVHRSEKFFPNAFQFDPERFLTPDGKSVKRIEQLIPFSIGRRLCLGEGLARMELFLIFTSLLQHFSLTVPPGQPPPSMESELNVTNEPPPFKALFTRRTGK